MSLAPNELLQQADLLVSRTTPTQADLRRAISSAIYAVFHFCLTAAADMVIGSSAPSTARYSHVYRSIDHKVLRGLCGQLGQTQPQNVAITPSSSFGHLQDFARLTASLYEQRILADYDPSRTYSETEVRVVISDARQAIAWFTSCDDEQQKAFLTMLLFRQR